MKCKGCCEIGAYICLLFYRTIWKIRLRGLSAAMAGGGGGNGKLKENRNLATMTEQQQDEVTPNDGTRHVMYKK